VFVWFWKENEGKESKWKEIVSIRVRPVVEFDLSVKRADPQKGMVVIF